MNFESQPSIQEATFLEMTAQDRRILRRAPTKAQLEALFTNGAFKYWMAFQRATANQSMSHFFSGVGLPDGVKDASPREAYFTGLVNANRETLDFPRKMWQQAVAKEPEEEPEPRELEKEEEMFASDIPTPEEVTDVAQASP